jgi:leucyl aminopeptidase (aminopeptidase T)
VDVGGTIQSDMHWDVVLGKPTIKVDGKIILEEGKIIV